MTDQEASVLAAIARGRLIYPFLEEMRGLQELATKTELASYETARLKALEQNFAKIKTKDEWFHSAMASGNIEAAGRVAEEVLAIIKEVA